MTTTVIFILLALSCSVMAGDDTGLEPMVQQQAAAITALQAELASVKAQFTTQLASA
jgi:hypothetical protein